MAMIGLPANRTGQAGRLEDLQTKLSWIGLYRGQINGQSTRELDAAIRLFQQGFGEQATGHLTDAQLRALDRRASATRRDARLLLEDQYWTGTRLRLPKGFLGDPNTWGDNDSHIRYRSQDVSNMALTIERYDLALSISQAETMLRQAAEKNDYRILVTSSEGGFTAMVGVRKKDEEGPERRKYSLYSTANGQLRGVEISLDEDSVTAMRPLIAEILGSFEPFHSAGLSKTETKARAARGEGVGRGQAAWMNTVRGTGSGSIVSLQGHVLSNHHVVEGCARLTVFGQDAILIGSDPRVDLSLIRVPSLAGRNPVRFSQTSPELGAELYVLGYPVFQDSQSLNLTSGVLSSTVGFFGDRRHMQMTAPVQPGNSGGPVLSSDGAQIGVVVSKPNITVSLGKNIENIAFMIRGAVARDFLERYEVPVINQSRNARPLPEDERGRTWRALTVRVECHRG
ncbi:serine protease [Pseudooceanicola pacificus]|nr:serine protease [Pseudooceanicola pacificus]